MQDEFVLAVDTAGIPRQKSPPPTGIELLASLGRPPQGDLRVDFVDVLASRTATASEGDRQLLLGNRQTRIDVQIGHSTNSKGYAVSCRESPARQNLKTKLEDKNLTRQERHVLDFHSLLRLPSSWVRIIAVFQVLTFWILAWPGGGLSAQQPDALDNPTSDWPRFLNSTYDGVASTPAEIDWTKKPKFLWSLDVGEGYGIGTVQGNSYLQFDADPSGRHERLRCLDLHSGRVRWSHSQPMQYRDLYQYERGPRSSPSIANDHVYTLGVGGQLTCRRLADGRVRWTVNTSESYGVVQNFFGVGSSPLVLGDQVIVMVGGSPADDANVAPGRLDRVSPNGTAVVAFDRKTGDEKWKCGDDLASYSSPRPIDLNGETLVLVFARGGLLAIDPKSGKVRWRFDHRANILESVNAMVPVVDGDLVLISECYQVGSVLLRVSPDAAAVVWQDPPRDRRAQSMRCHWATPVLSNGFLYGCSGRNAPDSNFRCVDLRSGEVKWSDPRRIRSSVTRVDNHLVLLEERGVVQVLKANPDRMEIISEWDFQLRDDDRPAISYPCWAAPVVVGNKLILRGTEQVLCLELAVVAR